MCWFRLVWKDHPCHQAAVGCGFFGGKMLSGLKHPGGWMSDWKILADECPVTWCFCWLFTKVSYIQFEKGREFCKKKRRVVCSSTFNFPLHPHKCWGQLILFSAHCPLCCAQMNPQSITRFWKENILDCQKQIVLWIHQPTNQPTKPSQANQPTNQQPTQPTNPTNQPTKPSQAKQPTNHPPPTSFPHEATELSALLAGEAAAEVAKLSKDQVSLGSPVDQQDPTYRFKKGRFSRLVYLHLYTWSFCFLGDVLKKFYHGIHHHFSTSDLGRVFLVHFFQASKIRKIPGNSGKVKGV